MRRWAQSHRRASIVALVVGLFVLSGLLRPQVEALEIDENRDELLEEAKAKGMTEEQASCFVDGMEDQFGPDLDSAGTSAGEVRETLAMTFECMGADLGGDDCLVDAVIEIMDLGDGAEAVEFVEAEASLDGDAREQIAEAGLRCQGASGEVAACVTDAMREEFGDDVFESRTGPGLSADGQQRIGALITECSTGASEPGGPSAGEVDCGPYTRAIGAAWSEVAPASFAPTATALAVANALERSAPDAPPELAGDVAVIVEAARGNAEQVEQTFGDAMSEEAALAAFKLANLEADAQMRVWIACPHLDSQLGEDGGDFDRMVFAIGGSQADMEEELLDCLQSARVAEPGDNEGCDDLVDACESGGYDACDDIWVWSDLRSAYEEIGASCGGRLEPDDELYGQGACEVLSG